MKVCMQEGYWDQLLEGDKQAGWDRGLVVTEAPAGPMEHSGMAWIAPNGGKETMSTLRGPLSGGRLPQAKQHPKRAQL